MQMHKPTKTKPNGYWKNLENVIKEVNKIKKEYDIDRLPSENTLLELGFGGLVGAIRGHHGDFAYFRNHILKEKKETILDKLKNKAKKQISEINRYEINESKKDERYPNIDKYSTNLRGWL